MLTILQSLILCISGFWLGPLDSPDFRKREAGTRAIENLHPVLRLCVAFGASQSSQEEVRLRGESLWDRYWPSRKTVVRETFFGDGGPVLLPTELSVILLSDFDIFENITHTLDGKLQSLSVNEQMPLFRDWVWWWGTWDTYSSRASETIVILNKYRAYSRGYEWNNQYWGKKTLVPLPK